MKIAIFEGPENQRLKGWRDYLINYGGQTRTFLSQPHKARETAENMRAIFFRCGEWEDQAAPKLPGQFHLPKPEILAALAGNGKQVEMLL
jgi:hypothetical protein